MTTYEEQSKYDANLFLEFVPHLLNEVQKGSCRDLAIVMLRDLLYAHIYIAELVEHMLYMCICEGSASIRTYSTEIHSVVFLQVYVLQFV